MTTYGETKTKPRLDGHESEYGRWIRSQPLLASGEHKQTITDIDYSIKKYADKNGHQHKIMIEAKCYKALPSFTQLDNLSDDHQALWQTYVVNQYRPERAYWLGRSVLHYHGWHIIQFERTSPCDGRIWIDSYEVDEAALLLFHRFVWMPPEKHWHPDHREGQMRWIPDHLNMETTMSRMAQADKKWRGKLPSDT